MARFFFHVAIRGERIEGEEGSECDDILGACKQAVVAVAEMAAEDLKAGTEDIEQRIVVADERGCQLLAVTVEAAIRVQRGSEEQVDEPR